jgi:predicted RNase H-like HicB family nuclease
MRKLILYETDDGLWIAECEELPGCRVTGKTREEAVEKIKAALMLYFPCRCED